MLTFVIASGPPLRRGESTVQTMARVPWVGSLLEALAFRGVNPEKHSVLLDFNGISFGDVRGLVSLLQEELYTSMTAVKSADRASLRIEELKTRPVMTSVEIRSSPPTKIMFNVARPGASPSDLRNMYVGRPQMLLFAQVGMGEYELVSMERMRVLATTANTFCAMRYPLDGYTRSAKGADAPKTLNFEVNADAPVGRTNGSGSNRGKRYTSRVRHGGWSCCWTR